MSEQLLYDVLVEAYNKEFADFNNAPKHRFSHSHKVKMRRLFDGDTAAPTTKPRIKLKYVWIAIILACVLVITGFVFMYFSDGFKGKVYHDNTWLFPTDIENCPEILEEVYSLPYVPDGFILLAEDETDYCYYSFYKNEKTGQSITFDQFVKSTFNVHANTEGFDLVETKINGCNAVYIDYSPKWNCADVIWDNGDYILELNADFSLEEVLNMARDMDAAVPTKKTLA